MTEMLIKMVMTVLFLMDGDHFLVKSNTEQIHILGNKQDIEGFKKFVKPGAAIEKEVIDNFENDVDVVDTTPTDTKSSLPPTKSGPASLDLKLDPDQPNDKGNLDNLGFEEDACEI